MAGTRFSMPKLPPASSQYSAANEQAFRRSLELAFSGLFVATNTAAEQLGNGFDLLGWTHDMVFSATDHDTVAWTSGNIYLPNGTVYAITGANTGNITTVTYIFFDLAVSATALQTSTSASAAVGDNRILIAVANDVASGKDAQFQVMGGADGSELDLITADVIAANTITADEIAANTITAAQIAANTITAAQIFAGTITANEIAADTITGTNIASLNISTKTITADTGTIGGWSLTASALFSGQLTLVAGASPKITMGTATDYATGDGVFLGLHSSVYKLRIGGASAAPYFRWSGTAIETSGIQLSNPAVGSSPSLLGWAQTCVFSASDADTVAWAAGNIAFSDGSSYAISGGNTGNMSAATTYYVYWDSSATTQYSATTTYSTAVGHGKVLVAVCRPASDATEAVFQVFGGSSGTFVFITADQIAANTITANEIFANTITTAQLAAGTLSATNITAGTLTASVVIASDSFTATNPVFDGDVVIRSGQGSPRYLFDTHVSGYADLYLYDENNVQSFRLTSNSSQTSMYSGVGSPNHLAIVCDDFAVDCTSFSWDLTGIPKLDLTSSGLALQDRFTAYGVNIPYAPGSMTVPTGYSQTRIRQLQLTGSQRFTLAGTARLRLSN